MDQPKKSLNLKEIILLKATFERPSNIVVDDPNKVKHDVGLEISNTDLNQESFAVFLDVTYKIANDGQEFFNAFVRMSGNFNKEGEHTLTDLEGFANVNAPAILFPFVREMIANLSAKAMVGPVLMQPVNFVQLNKERIEREQKQKEGK